MAESSKQSQEFEYSEYKKHIDSLLSDWSDEQRACEKRRELREKVIDHAQAVKDQLISDNELYIVRRVIDRNIRQEKPEQINYIESAPHLILFRSRTKPNKDTTLLADWFTKGMRYAGWSDPWHRLFDATDLHGAAPIEIRLSESTPFGLELEFCPREDFIIPVKTKKTVQILDLCLRRYHYLPSQLEDMEAQELITKDALDELMRKDTSDNRTKPRIIYRVFARKDDIIYSWLYSDEIRDKWLSKPEPLDFGLMENGISIPMSIFPWAYMLHEIQEKEEILSIKGRAFKDLPDQEAISQLTTDVVNGCHNATDIQASQVVNPIHGESSQVIPHKRNTIYPRELRWNQAQWPDPVILQTAQLLNTENLQAAGRVDYAVSNRKDARKTRAEILAAQDQSVKLSSVSIVPEGNVIVQVYGICWFVVRNKVLNKEISIENTGLSMEDFTDLYELLPAGDTEVVKRAEMITNLQQDIPLFQGTPLMGPILQKYIALRYPEQAVEWSNIMNAASDLRPIVQALLEVIQTIPINKLPPGELNPQELQQLQQIIQNATAALQAGAPGGAPGVASGPTDPADAQPA